MKTLAVLVLIASCVEPCLAAMSREVLTTTFQDTALTFCQRALNARDATEILAIEAFINDLLNRRAENIKSEKKLYDEGRDELRKVRLARDNAERAVADYVAERGYEGSFDVLMRFKAAEEALAAKEVNVADVRRGWTKAVAAAYAEQQFAAFVSECLEIRRIELKAPPRITAGPAIAPFPVAGTAQPAQCITSSGPFRCTGRFPATWQLTCARAAANDGGPAVLLLGPDGTAQAQFTSRIANNRIDPVVGRIGADGFVRVERSDGTGGHYLWEGRFALQALASGIVRPVGSATMSYRGGPMDCGGQFTLLQ